MKIFLKLFLLLIMCFTFNVSASVLDRNWAVNAGFKLEYNSTDAIDNITSIKFFDTKKLCSGTTVDVSASKDESIILCIKDSTLEFSSSSKIEFPQDSSYLFSSFSTANIDFNSSVDTSKVEDMSHMFENFASDAASLELNLSDFDTSKVEDMSSMFQNVCNSCDSVYINLKSFNTLNVSTMQKMFSKYGYNANKVIIDGLENFNTTNVTNMSAMFYYAGTNADDLSLNLSNFDTSNVTSFSEMFRSSSVNYLDLSNFDTSKATTLNSMFYGASKLVYLDISNFNILGTSKYILNGNHYLQVLKLGPNNYEKVRVDIAPPSATYLPGTINKWFNEGGEKIDPAQMLGVNYYAYEPYKIEYYENDQLIKMDYKAKDIDYIINASKANKNFNVTIKFDTDGGNLLTDLIFHNRTEYIAKAIEKDKTLYNNGDVYNINAPAVFNVIFDEKNVYETLDLPKAEKEGYTFIKWSSDNFIPDSNQTLKAIYEINNPNTGDNIWIIVGGCSFLALLLVGMIILIKKFKD